MKDDSREFEKQTRRRMQAALDEIYAKRSGEFTNESLVIEVADLLTPANLNEFRFVLARRVIESEDSARRAIPIPTTLDMFNDELLHSSLIALGQGLRVKLGDAVIHHLQKKIGQQQDAIDAATASMQKWLMLIDNVMPVMGSDPTLTLRSWFIQKGVIRPE